MIDEYCVGLCECVWLGGYVVSMDYWCAFVCGSLCVAAVGEGYVY